MVRYRSSATGKMEIRELRIKLSGDKLGLKMTLWESEVFRCADFEGGAGNMNREDTWPLPVIGYVIFMKGFIYLFLN